MCCRRRRIIGHSGPFESSPTLSGGFQIVYIHIVIYSCIRADILIEKAHEGC